MQKTSQKTHYSFGLGGRDDSDRILHDLRFHVFLVSPVYSKLNVVACSWFGG